MSDSDDPNWSPNDSADEKDWPCETERLLKFDGHQWYVKQPHNFDYRFIWGEAIWKYIPHDVLKKSRTCNELLVWVKGKERKFLSIVEDGKVHESFTWPSDASGLLSVLQNRIAEKTSGQ